MRVKKAGRDGERESIKRNLNIRIVLCQSFVLTVICVVITTVVRTGWWGVRLMFPSPKSLSKASYINIQIITCTLKNHIVYTFETKRLAHPFKKTVTPKPSSYSQILRFPMMNTIRNWVYVIRKGIWSFWTLRMLWVLAHMEPLSPRLSSTINPHPAANRVFQLWEEAN